jgi:hypothetical protein
MGSFGSATVMTIRESSLETWLGALTQLLLFSPWVWMAVRTKDFLQFVTAHRVPFPKRTIWLAKIFALILGSVGVFAALDTIGLPRFLSLLASGAVVFFTFMEDVQVVLPPKPAQDAGTLHASWKQYRELRGAYVRTFVWVGAALLCLVLTFAVSGELPESVRTILIAGCLLVLLFSVSMNTAGALRFYRWPCPRCGCAFNGFWIRPWFKKKCVYCGLPREDNAMGSRQ